MTEGTSAIGGVTVSHERASVGDLDAAAADSQRTGVEAILSAPGIEEAFVLQTCNRVEAYAVGPDEVIAEALAEFVEGVPESALRELDHEASLRHLLRVAAGLESIVLGEDQILGQVREAYEDARSAGGIGPVLEDGVSKALQVGKRARTETAINEGAVSLASAAVRKAAEETDLEGESGLVVGTGEMGTLAAESLADRVDHLVVANRTVPHAEYLADTVDVEASAVGLNALPTAAERARVVVSATGSPDPIFETDVLAEAGETVAIDLAQPRDVPAEAAALPNVTVHDLDTLESLTDETRQKRREAAGAVEAIVDEEFDRLLAQYKRKRADRVISAMYESAERVKAKEVQTAMSKLDLDEDESAVVESMADAIVSQLLSAPTKSLRDAAENDDWSTIHTALQLFDPDFGPSASGEGPPAFVEDVAVDEIPPEMREQMPAAVLEQLDD